MLHCFQIYCCIFTRNRAVTVSLCPIATVKEESKGDEEKVRILEERGKHLCSLAVQSVTCGFLFLRFQSESLPIQIILNMLFKLEVSEFM